MDRRAPAQSDQGRRRLVCPRARKCPPCFAKLASSLDNVDCFTVDVTDKTDVDGVWSVFKAVGGVKLPYFALYKDHQRVEGVQTSDIDVVKGLVQKHLAADKTEAPFVEPLLKDDIDRFVLFPLKNKPLWDMYKKHESTFWTAEELDLEADKKDFKESSTTTNATSSSTCSHSLRHLTPS